MWELGRGGLDEPGCLDVCATLEPRGVTQGLHHQIALTPASSLAGGSLQMGTHLVTSLR